MGENYTAEKYRNVLKGICDMDMFEREKVFGIKKPALRYAIDYPASEIIEKYNAYINSPKTGEYWKRKETGKMIVVRYVKNNTVYVYLCDGGNTDYCSLGHFADNYTKTEYKSKYLELLFEEMKEMSK